MDNQQITEFNKDQNGMYKTMMIAGNDSQNIYFKKYKNKLIY